MTHSTAIECSTVTEIENQLLFDDGIAAKGRSLTGQMMNIDLKRLSSGVPSIVSKEDKGEYIQSLVDSREKEDSSIAQNVMLRHHIANLDRRVLQYQGNDIVNTAEGDTVNDTVKALELTDNISRVLDAIKVHPEYTYNEYASMLSLGRATVARAIKQLQSNGYIRRLGSDKTGRWTFSK